MESAVPRTRRILWAGFLTATAMVLALVSAVTGTEPSRADAETSVAAAESTPTVAVYRFFNPVESRHFFTPSSVERDHLITHPEQNWRYEGTAFSAFAEQAPGTIPVFRFFSRESGHFWTADAYEASVLRTRYAATWNYEGIAYYAYPPGSTAAGAQPLYRFTTTRGQHFFTVSREERDGVIALFPGYWIYEGEGFLLPADPVATDVPPAATGRDGDGSFTLATFPDTQNIVFAQRGPLFVDASRWLVSQRDALDLRFVAHTGDVVNWDTDDHSQYVIAEAALDPLEEAGIPYQLSIGNHDTMATGVGGGARDTKRTREYQRTTTTFNAFWTAADYAAVAGAFEAGKVDNVYSTFRAEGARWLVLTLELWPRMAVVDWAEDVIRAHPDYNVVIQTHSLLTSDATVEPSGLSLRFGYGDTSPQYVYARLVSPYANVKIVTSGHVGVAASRVVTAPNGNRIAFLLQAIHSARQNPVRLSRIDVSAGVVDTRVFAPSDGAVWDPNVLSGLAFIRSD